MIAIRQIVQAVDIALIAQQIHTRITAAATANCIAGAVAETGDAAAKVELSTSANPNFSYAKRSKIFSE